MDISDYSSAFLAASLGTVPYVLFWIVVLVLSVRRLKRDGGRAERFLVAGATIHIINSLLYIPSIIIIPLLVTGDSSFASAGTVYSLYNLGREVISMSGMVCFIYAFWVKFKARDSSLRGTDGLTPG